MRKLLLLIVCLMAMQYGLAQDQSPEQRMLVSNATKLREWRTTGNFDPKPYVEKLTKTLGSSHAQSYSELYAKLSLAWYYTLEANQNKTMESLYTIPLSTKKSSIINYNDLYNVLAASRKYEKLADSCYLLCAYEAGDYFSNKKEWEKAINAYTYAYESAKLMYKTQDYPKQCFRAYKMLGFAYYEVRDKRAGFMEALAADNIPKSFPDRENYYYRSLYSAGKTYSVFENDAKADSCFAICEKHYEKDEPIEKRADFFRHRAQSFKNLGKGALAVDYYKKANQYESDLSRQLENRNYILEILDKSGDREGYLSAIRDGLQFIEKCYSRLDKYQVFLFVQKCNSENFNTKSYLDSFTTFIETQPKSNDVILVATKAYAYYASGKYKIANRYKNEAERLFADSGYDENDYGKDKERDIAYQKEHSAVIGLLQVFNDIDKQLENQQNTLRKIESLLGKDSRRYKDFEVTIASLNLMHRNNYYDAERLSDSLLSHSAKGSVDYYNAMKLKAVIAIYTGQSLRAAEYYREIAKGETDPRAKYQYLLYDANFVCLDIMRRDMNRSGQGDKARLIADMENTVGELSSIAEKHFSKTGKDYFDMLNAKALLMYIKHNKSTMMRIVSQMEDIERQTSNPNVKKSELSSLASLYAWNGDFKKALMLLKDDDPEAQTSDRDKYKHYITFASMNLGAGNTSKAIDYYTKGVYYGIDDVRKLFPLMTAAERSSYWNQFKSAFYNAGKYATVFDKENVFNGTLYDLALYSKGLLMRSQNAIVAKIRALGDSSLLEDIQTIQQLRMAVANGKSGSEKQAAMQEDAEKLEKEFLQACVRKGYNIESEFSNYQDVKSKLSAKDAAVEFVLYFDKDTVGHYGALVLRNNYKYPIFVHISEKESLENSLSFDAKTTQTIWNPLLPYFNGIENVYFSPIGKIHKFAIEYLPFNDTEMIADKYNLFRVSSTAELVKRNSTTSFNYTKAVIYGGIYYDTDTLTMREVVTDQTRENSGNGVLCYLKGTLKEAQTISSVFKNSHIQVELFDDWSATEESFKRLSGKNNDIVHIGTHGFCKVTDNDLRLAISGSNSQVDGDYAMNNSGLYFSGANNALRGYRAYGLEDGVLTAKEISSLDFSKTDLITLSACVTGDGDITGEGVFGVQRGFKLARANSLVMSCWSVDDNATNLLMSEFYTNLTKGMTKRKSLLEAVKIVKAKYTSPHKWAAFVLLDGLN